MNLDLYKQISQISEGGLITATTKILQRSYKSVHTTVDYVYAEGEIPILLVAHLDTVHPKLPVLICHDPEEHILWSPYGLGADDRAGVYAILDLIAKGYRPSVLFTTHEETGGFGARQFCTDFMKLPTPVNFIIELDRQGVDDAVYYECGNYEFEDFITSFGFSTAFGTFSDISIIGPYFDIAAVNLSIGYFQEHTLGEFLRYDLMDKTIKKVEKILKSKSISYDYREIVYTLPREYNGLRMCDACDTALPKEQLKRVKEKHGTEVWYLCPTCLKLNEDIVEVCEYESPRPDSK